MSSSCDCCPKCPKSPKVCQVLFDSCLCTQISCDNVQDLEVVPSAETYSKRYRIVFYALLGLCIFRWPFSLKTVLDAFEAIEGDYRLLPAATNITEETKRLYSVLRTFLAIISTAIPLTGLVATLWRSHIICIVSGVLWAAMLSIDMSVALTFGEQLFHIQYVVDTVIICLFFYFSRLIVKERNYF